MSDEPALDLPVDPVVEEHPLVRAAVEIATRLLGPQAAAVDGGTVPRSHLDALAACGLLGVAAPPEAGGSAAPAPAVRRITEVLAGADLSTWFVQAQHHFPVRAVATAGSHPQLLADLAAGRRVAGIAFSHLRRPDVPVTATRNGGGWRLDGVAPWYTGWGINDVALLAGATSDGDAVFCLVPARPGPGLRASEPMPVAALQAARTVTLTLDGLRVPDDAVVSRSPIQEWAAADRRGTVNANPAVFGLTASAITLLADHARRRHEPAARGAAERLRDRWVAVRGRAYALLDEVPPDDAVAERLRIRAQAGRLAIEATTALVVAGAGGAMAASAPAQRKAREALFLLVQAQTRDARATALDAVAR